MPALPLANAFTGSGVTEAQFKTAITDQREFLAGLLGTSGTQAAALSAIGAALNGVIAKTVAYTVLSTDRGKLIDCTSGTWTLTLAAAATLGDGFVFVAINTGSGVITIDPNGAETINGASTLTLNAGEWRICVCNGTAWKAMGAAATAVNVQSFSASGTWVKPTGLTGDELVIVEAWGGGGGGSAGGGGGGGAYIRREFKASDLGTTESVQVGAGGAINTAGGNSNFGSGKLIAYGGGGAAAGLFWGGGGGGWAGAGGTATTSGGAAGLGVYGGIDAGAQGSSTAGVSYSAFYGGGGGIHGGAAGQGGKSVWGGGGGGTNTGGGGTSLFGGGTGGTGLVAGSAPGGGGGTNGSTTGTAGGAGRVIVRVIKS